MIAQTLGYLAGLDAIPGFMTAIGTVFAIYGIMYIDKGNRERQQQLENAHHDDECHEGSDEQRRGGNVHDITMRGGMSGLDTSKLDDSSFIDLNMSHLSGR